jgi:hypothetical protein
MFICVVPVRGGVTVLIQIEDAVSSEKRHFLVALAAHDHGEPTMHL